MTSAYHVVVYSPRAKRYTHTSTDLNNTYMFNTYKQAYRLYLVYAVHVTITAISRHLVVVVT